MTKTQYMLIGFLIVAGLLIALSFLSIILSVIHRRWERRLEEELDRMRRGDSSSPQELNGKTRNNRTMWG